jgi:hypothetical protein
MKADDMAEPNEFIKVREVHAAIPNFKFDCKINLKIPL